MKTINCACPRCGKQTTEYDENKWTCLLCGNKFVIKEEAPINYNTSFNINSDTLYDLDVNNKKEFEIKEEEVIIGYKDELNNNEFARIKKFYLRSFQIIFAPLSLLILINTFSHKEYTSSILVCVVFSFLMSGFLFGFFAFITIIFYKVFLQKGVPIYGAIKVVYSYCPYCNKILHSYKENDMEQFTYWSFGLTHCRHCGKQFVIQEGVSYGINGKSPLPPPLPSPLLLNWSKVKSMSDKEIADLAKNIDYETFKNIISSK